MPGSRPAPVLNCHPTCKLRTILARLAPAPRMAAFPGRLIGRVSRGRFRGCQPRRERTVELGLVTSMSHVGIRKRLKKTVSRRRSSITARVTVWTRSRRSSCWSWPWPLPIGRTAGGRPPWELVSQHHRQGPLPLHYVWGGSCPIPGGRPCRPGIGQDPQLLAENGQGRVDHTGQMPGHYYSATKDYAGGGESAYERRRGLPRC